MFATRMASRQLFNSFKPAVVLELRPGNVNPTKDCGVADYLEPADVRIGVLSHREEFVGFWADGARLMPYRAETPFEKALSEPMECNAQPSAPAEAVDAFSGHASTVAQEQYRDNDPFGSAPPEAHDQPEKRPNWRRDSDPIAEHDRPAAYPKWPANN